MANRLTQELGIDCKSSGRQSTTRVHQALETLQDVLFSLRTGRFKTMPPVLGSANPAANWVLALDPAKPYLEADFDEEWRWMGTYATWHAAIRVFAYPESYLLPELRPQAAQTAAYKNLMKDLRDQQRLSPAQARNLAAAYHQALTTELGTTLPETLRKGALLITEQLSDTQLADRRSFIQGFFSGIANPHLAPAHIKEIFYFVPMALALQLQKSGQYLAALDWIETVYTDHLAVDQRKIYRGLVLEETIATQYQRNPDNWLRVGLNPHEIVAVRASAYTRFTLMVLVRCYLEFADAEFTRDSSESVARARALYGTALELLALPEMQPSGGQNPPSPFTPNPVPEALRLHAELNLFKLRSGRNIAGIERQSAPETSQPVTFGTLPVAPQADRLLRPTPYRYGALIERAKNLVNIAQQVEAAFLATLEKRDAEMYSLLKAGHDLQLAGSTVDLHALRVTEAEGGVTLAELQQDRSETQRDTYQGWLDAGLNRWERDMLRNYEDAKDARNWLAGIDAAMTVAQSLKAASEGGFLGTGLGAGLGGTILIGALAVSRAAESIVLNNAESAAQVNSAQASFERRQNEWALQRQLADHEVAIGAQQIDLALTHTDIARKEESIARTQRDQAQATVEFLANKFTSAELYAWMSGILGGAYSYFLQQATALAQLAQHQLAFERQETPPAFIKADYWEAPGESATPTGGDGKEPDRRGLTGSVRLLQDVTRLDQFAFDTHKRKLQLAQTFSLAQLFPAEFQRFRDTGSLPFTTSMSLFDQGFPGHYLRLIKRVRVSVIALIPPTRGLRATLVNSGLSRVVSGGDLFQTVVVRRDPELIAFTSPSNANGLLELEPEGELLLPFESMGVDTSWELQLPRAANPFDYRTIADVLFTIEYTALHSFTYRQQVIQQLGDTVSSERALSLRDEFADEWYALHNPVPANAPLRVRFKTVRGDFPPNLDDLRIQQVLLAFVRAPGKVFETGDTGLMLTAEGDTVPIGGAAGGSIEGIVSTRRSNGAGWAGLVGKAPMGEWELAFPDTVEMRNRFKNEEIEDILLVLTFEGQPPAWPA
ncbi:MAG: neuraminidase-like domain-containing protein [Rhodocyclaceae bacterium]